MDVLLQELQHTVFPQEGYVWGICKLQGSNTKQLAKKLAAILAKRIIIKRLPPDKVDLWTSKYDGQLELTSIQSEQLLAYLEPDFGRPGQEKKQGDWSLEGAVSEALWYELISKRDENDFELIRVEAHNYSVTDQGGDGLVVYRTDQGSLTFRLWEIKQHNTQGPVRATVTNAHSQLKSKALKYLARFSGVYEQISEDELKEFYTKLVDYWQEEGPEAGAGVAVSATIKDEVSDVYDGLVTRFPNLAGRLEGHTNAFANYAEFCELVRDEIWKGL